MEDVPEPPINPNFEDFDDDEEDQTSDLRDDDDDLDADDDDDDLRDDDDDLDADDDDDDLRDDDDDDLRDDDDERKIENFMKDLPSRASFRRPESEYHLWSFWSEPTLSLCSGGSITDSATHTPTTNQPIITDIIKSALLHFDRVFEKLLIQFWAPITTETGCVQLVTADQPFALSHHLDERLLNYRKGCLQYKFHVDGEEVEGLGIPGLVFRQKWHEFIPHVRYYSVKEYPQRDFALACHISCCFCVPVFQSSFQDCVGVLEFAATTIYSLYLTRDLFLKDGLKPAGLKTSLCDRLICKFFDRDDHRNIRAEIYKGLRVVCKTHDLPLAKTWIPCGHFNGDGNLDNSYDTFDVSCMGPAFHCDLEASYRRDHNMEEFFYYENNFQNWQGVVRSAYQSHKLCFCRDLTQFSITEYPSLPLARACGLTGCFAIYLQSTRAKNYHYVLEFFLNPKNTYGEDPSTILCSIFETMKQHFPSFKLASGEELGKESQNEVIKPRPPNQELVIELRDTNNGRNVVNAEPNVIPVSCSDEAINSITYEEIKRHFGKKLEDVAQIFDVSRSTFKRICRKNGIHRWKRGKRNKVKGSPSGRDPPYSNLSAEKLVATVAHMTPLVTTQEVRALTIKAKFGGFTIKFQLPSTSGMVELGEEVFKRLKIDVGTYNISYNDGEDQILIACDEDLRDCMSASDSLGTIKLFIEPITQISPSVSDYRKYQQFLFRSSHSVL